jgi:hypothetical protein
VEAQTQAGGRSVGEGALTEPPEHRCALDAIAAARDAVEAGAGKVLVDVGRGRSP